MIAKARSVKGKIDKLDVIRMKSLCSVKGLIRMKRQAARQEKTFASHISDQRPVSRIYKELSKVNKKLLETKK